MEFGQKPSRATKELLGLLSSTNHLVFRGRNDGNLSLKSDVNVSSVSSGSVKSEKSLRFIRCGGEPVKDSRTDPQISRHFLSGQGHKANSPVGSGASAHGHCCVSIANKTRSCPQKNRQPRVKTTKMTKMTKIATDSTIPTNFLNKYW